MGPFHSVLGPFQGYALIRIRNSELVLANLVRSFVS